MLNSYRAAFLLSVALHLLLAGVLLLGDFSAPIKPTLTSTPIEPIKAVAVDKNKIEQQVSRIKKQKADEAKRLQDLEKQLAVTKRKRQKEEDRLKNLERQRKKKLQEKKAADAAAQQAKAKANAADKLRQQKELERKKAEKAAADAKAKRLAEEKAAKKAKQLREKKAAERRRKEQEAKELAEQQKMLAEQMAAEMASRQQARRQQMMTEIERFTALISQTIQRNLITDRATMEGKSCKLTISLAPSGFVTNVVIVNGDRIVCEAAKTAVYKAGTLPVSKDPDVFSEMKIITLTVKPENFN